MFEHGGIIKFQNIHKEIQYIHEEKLDQKHNIAIASEKLNEWVYELKVWLEWCAPIWIDCT